MESYFPYFIPDSESSIGSNSKLSSGITLATPVPRTMFQCCECFRLFLFEKELVEHQVESNSLCSYITKSSNFLQRFGLSQQATPTLLALVPPPPQRPYYQNALSLLVGTAEGSATHDPFGDTEDHKPLLVTLDLVSNFGPYAGARANEVRDGQEKVDVELKL